MNLEKQAQLDFLVASRKLYCLAMDQGTGRIKALALLIKLVQLTAKLPLKYSYDDAS